MQAERRKPLTAFAACAAVERLHGTVGNGALASLTRQCLIDRLQGNTISKAHLSRARGCAVPHT